MQKVEEEGAIALRGQSEHHSLRLRIQLGEDDHHVGRSPAEARTVVHDLGGHLAGSVVKKDHESLRELSGEYRIESWGWRTTRLRSRSQTSSTCIPFVRQKFGTLR